MSDKYRQISLFDVQYKNMHLLHILSIGMSKGWSFMYTEIWSKYYTNEVQKSLTKNTKIQVSLLANLAEFKISKMLNSDWKILRTQTYTT